MSSPQYFEFLGTVWDLLPQQDQERFGELWQGFEQTIAAVYQKFVEGNLNITVQNLQPFTTERWLPYIFTDENLLELPAVYTSTQDISVGINLTNRYLLRISVDGGSPIEIDARGANPGQTFLPEIVSKLNAAFMFTLAKGIFDNSILQLTSPTVGIGSSVTIWETSDPTKNAAEFILGLISDDLPITVPEYPWVYETPYSGIAEIPELQDAVRDESVKTTLISGTDFVTDRQTIAFKAIPPERMWARRTLVDEENPWNNYGFLMDIYQPNSQRYVNVLQGLWFAFWTGPRPSNLRTSLYLLFGLPTAHEDGTVTEVTPTTIETTGANGTVRTFEIPSGLLPIVSEGEAVKRFQPLVSGIEIFDKINKPGFITDEIGRAGIGRFLTENATTGSGDTDETKALTMLEEYTFLPQISVEAFITPDINIDNVKIFLDAIKPLNKAYLFQVIVGTFKDEIDLKENLFFDYEIDVTPSLDSNETTYQEQPDLDNYETVDDPGLNLDPDVVVLQESVDVEVYSFGGLIDSFTV